MTTTKAQALAVALDHAEETGEYPPELVARVVEMFDGLRIVQLVKAGPGDSTSRGRRTDGHLLVSITRHHKNGVCGDDVPPAFRAPNRFNPGWRYDVTTYEAVVHTVLTGTNRCERGWFGSHDEAVAWLRGRLAERGWTLLEMRP